mmetsp:Transcript_17587/g.38485  ORF Transcript_17587/g.38485 Transcript_17587/m.38485 type:complete len:547 (-) Transcript_17587:29-1669(-)
MSGPSVFFGNLSNSETMMAVTTFFDVGIEKIFVISCLAAAFIVSLIGQMTYYNQASPEKWKGTAPKQAPEGMVWREVLGESVGAVEESEKIKEKRSQGKSKKLTWEEVSKHNTADDLWLVIDGCAYDVTRFLEKHPGGARPLLHMAGRDATDVMAEYHPATVFERLLPSFYVGDVVDYSVPELIADYREIRQGLLARGLFKTSVMYYFAKYTWLASIFVPSVYGVVFCSSFFAHMLSACGLALFWQQLAFVGHDLGHNAVSHDLKFDHYWGGMFGNLLGGIALGWWKANHNTHHVTCNSVEHDPDIQHLPAMAISKELFGKFWSTYYEKYFVTDGVARFLVSYQHFLYYPIMMVARFNLYVQSYVHLLLRKNEKLPFRAMEVCSLLGFAAWMGALLSCLPNTRERVYFLLLSHALAGVLHVQITISHFSMETFHGVSKDDWIQHQMKTTENVSCPTYMDWFHGGLQFQLEHHLFPRLPRHNLRIAREQILKLAEKHKLPYIEHNFFSANLRCLKTLYRAAQDAKKLEKGDGGFYESPIWDGVNARG